MKVPARWAAFEAREGMVEIGALPIRTATRAWAKTLGTMDQATRVFEAVAAQGGYLDPSGGDARRALYVRDAERPEWLVPVPLLEHAWHALSVTLGEIRIAQDEPLVPADAPEGWKPGDPYWGEVEREPDILPRGPNMRAGSLRIAEGPAHQGFGYDDRGRLVEREESAVDQFTSWRYAATRGYSVDPLARPPTPRPVGIMLRGDLEVRGHSVEDAARMLAELEPGRTVAGRVRVPVSMPGGPRAAFATALLAMRRALYRGEVPGDARWLVADGLSGTVVAWGTTREDALVRFGRQAEQSPPRAPGAAPPSNVVPLPPKDRPAGPLVDREGKTTGVSLGTFTVQAPPGADIPWPSGSLDEVPVAIVPLAAAPEVVPAPWRDAGFARWARSLDGGGATCPVLVRDDDDGWTGIGEGILDLVAPGEIDDGIAAALAWEAELVDDPAILAMMRVGHRHFRVVDEVGRARGAWRPASGSGGNVTDGAGLDGESARWHVTRVRDR